MLQIVAKLAPDRRVDIITYNRSLADECKSRIKELSLNHRVNCYTIHGFVSRIAGKVCYNDMIMKEILDGWESGINMPKSFPLDLVMLDEAQDLRPSFHKLLSHIFSTCTINKIFTNTSNDGYLAPSSLQLCLVGDPKVSSLL